MFFIFGDRTYAFPYIQFQWRNMERRHKEGLFSTLCRQDSASFDTNGWQSVFRRFQSYPLVAANNCFHVWSFGYVSENNSLLSIVRWSAHPHFTMILASCSQPIWGQNRVWEDIVNSNHSWDEAMLWHDNLPWDTMYLQLIGTPLF